MTVSDILTYTDGSLSASWLIRGDGLITVSLAHAEIARRDEQAHAATITLPLPIVFSARVDHEKTVFWDAKQGLWNKVNPWGKNLDAIHSQAMKAAQRLVTQSVGSAEHLEQAQQRAARLIQRIYAELGWKVLIEWRAAAPRSDVEQERSSTDAPVESPGRFWSLSDLPPTAVTAVAL